MGAHGCGLLRRYLGFRINKIIGKYNLSNYHIFGCVMCLRVKIVFIFQTNLEKWKVIRIVFDNIHYVFLGLDAALPLILNSNRLSWRDATSVQTIQTNAGYYGDLGSIGHSDVCVNNGNIQPFCKHSQSMKDMHFTNNHSFSVDLVYYISKIYRCIFEFSVSWLSVWFFFSFNFCLCIFFYSNFFLCANVSIFVVVME